MLLTIVGRPKSGHRSQQVVVKVTDLLQKVKLMNWLLRQGLGGRQAGCLRDSASDSGDEEDSMAISGVYARMLVHRKKHIRTSHGKYSFY